MSFNHYYQSELTAMRQLGRRFAGRSPALALFLGQAGRDSDVERLLKGFASLTGRLRQKFDVELPELGWHIGLVLNFWFEVGVMVGEIWRNLLVRTRFRSARLVLSASLMLVALSFYFVDDNLSQRRPHVIELSYSKQYIVERVPFVSLFSGKALSYLRVTNQDAPEYIYRSSLYPTELLKMQISEVEGKVSIPNVEFLTSEKNSYSTLSVGKNIG